MVPLIQELGSNAIIPSEPRTQGAWTPPSHASMLTGTHPGKHGFVELARTLGRDGKRPIDPKLTTISKLLTDNGYKCSGTVSHSQILPKFGFGRGFHRFNYDGMSYSDWISREHDVKSSVNKLINWIDQDTAIRDHSLFYFLHVFDPHYPYIPPTEFLKSSTIDFSKPKKFKEEFQQFGNSQWTYVDGYKNNIDTNKQIIKDIQSWYSKSVKYTANKISHLINHIKKAGIFEDSLIIITGDHGEEFGQRGFVTHRTVYDNNIRPFMTIKPPASKSWSGIEEIDTIDFLPTIARIIGSKIPDQCDGTPIQDGRKKSHRITENIYPDWYNISVEIDGIKKIFTYRSNYPNRPTKKTIQSGPHLTEYYELSSVRRGNTQGHDPGRQTKTNFLLNIAEDFILNNDSYSGDATTSGPTQETLNQLESLGYQ